MTQDQIDALAREICGIMPAMRTEEWQKFDRELAAILRRHVPEGPGVVTQVVELTGDDVFAAHPEAMAGDSYFYDMALMLNRVLRLRARAAATDTIPCRVVRRPVEMVSELRVPETGRYWVEFESGWSASKDGHDQRLTGGDVAPVFARRIRRIDTPEPTTWIERTTTPQPRAWTAGDVPEGRVYADLTDGSYLVWDEDADRAKIADVLNHYNAAMLLVLPIPEARDAAA